jgi:hypothetical protein
MARLAVSPLRGRNSAKRAWGAAPSPRPRRGAGGMPAELPSLLPHRVVAMSARQGAVSRYALPHQPLDRLPLAPGSPASRPVAALLLARGRPHHQGLAARASTVRLEPCPGSQGRRSRRGARTLDGQGRAVRFAAGGMGSYCCPSLLPRGERGGVMGGRSPIHAS